MVQDFFWTRADFRILERNIMRSNFSISRLLALFFCGGLFFMLSACNQILAPAGGAPAMLPSLVTHSEAPRELLSINSVYIFPPSFSSGARAASSKSANFYDALCKSSAAELTIEALCSKDIFHKFEWETSQSPLARALDAAKKAAKDAVLLTTVNGFSEREGSRIAVNQPAALSFEMKLIRISDQKEIWSASYFFQDKALSENLFKTGQKLEESGSAAWQDAHNLIANAFSKSFRDLSTKRVEQFS